MQHAKKCTETMHCRKLWQEKWTNSPRQALLYRQNIIRVCHSLQSSEWDNFLLFPSEVLCDVQLPAAEGRGQQVTSSSEVLYDVQLPPAEGRGRQVNSCYNTKATCHTRAPNYDSITSNHAQICQVNVQSFPKFTMSGAQSCIASILNLTYVGMIRSDRVLIRGPCVQ